MYNNLLKTQIIQTNRFIVSEFRLNRSKTKITIQ